MPIADDITADLQWREDELAAMKHIAGNSASGSVAERAQLRALWAMLYLISVEPQ